MTFSPGPASFIRGPKSASPSNTRGGSRVPEWGPLGSVRGALSNERPYRDLRNVGKNYPFERSRRFPDPKSSEWRPYMFARDQWHCRICGDRFLYSEMVRKHIANEHNETMPPSMSSTSTAQFGSERNSHDLALSLRI